MGAIIPRTEQSKTECPFCGNVWQEHTLNETDGCMAMMHLQFSAAIARDASPKGENFLLRWQFESCPVCNKLPDEHTEGDLRSCVHKWRKRERGATGLEVQGEFDDAQNEEPGQAKRAQLKTWLRQGLCSCGKALGDHTRDEIRACALRREGERRREI
jgi:hypothetical protein